jgi:hypothetical protein
MKFQAIEVPYASPGGARLVWRGVDENDEQVVVLTDEELRQLVEIFEKNLTGKIELTDQVSTVLINSDITQFNLQYVYLEVKTDTLRRSVLDYVKVYHKYLLPTYTSSQFYHPLEQKDSEKKISIAQIGEKSMLEQILSSEISQQTEKGEYDIFKIISKRRSTRRFTRAMVEDWKIDKILAAADSAPTAGNFQAFQVFYIKNAEVKRALVEAANNQPYVNAPAVFVFFMDPKRIKMKLPPMLFKNSLCKTLLWQHLTLSLLHVRSG